MIYRNLVKPLLFRLDPETAHHLAIGALECAQSIPGAAALLAMLFGAKDSRGPVKLWGLEFPNRLGLAAGFDKNAKVARMLARLGFGFIEVGAVSKEARPGNPRPRIFRLPADRGLINRMGLPNDGAEAIAARLRALGRLPVPCFANIVKTSDLTGDAETMAKDYLVTLRAILPVTDGVTVNVSCPATPELKAFGKKDAMRTLLTALSRERDAILAGADGRFRPMLLKVSPDIDLEERNVILEATVDKLVDGLVLTNTTTTRLAGMDAPPAVLAERGGMSGKPLQAKSLEMIGWFADRLGGRAPIIGVGGIFDAADANRALDAGATLVEIYTGYIYGGPSTPKRIVRGMR